MRNSMKPVTRDLIEQAISLIGVENATDEDVEQSVLELAGETLTARRLIDCIPEAFGIVLVSHIENVNAPTTFVAFTSSGKPKHFDFAAEPILCEALIVAQTLFHSGRRDVFERIATRSAILGAVNKAFDKGLSLKGATLEAPVFMGIPADTYEEVNESMWRRLFG